MKLGSRFGSRWAFSDPHLATRLNAFVRQSEVIPVLRGIAEIFRDSDVLRENRERARLKFLFLRHGWTADTFQRELEKRIGFKFEPAADEQPPDDVYRDHVGIHAQKQAGQFYLGAAVLRGRISAAQMQTAAIWPIVWRRRNSHHQHAEPDRRECSARERRVSRQADRRRAACAGFGLLAGAIAAAAPNSASLRSPKPRLSHAGWSRNWKSGFLVSTHLKLHVTGCPNSCGQHWIADIGIEGKKIKVGDRMQDAYYFCVGGAVGVHRSIARAVGYRCLATEVPDAIERLLRRYLDDRRPNENLRQFFARHSDEEMRECLAGEMDRPGIARSVAGAGAARN